MDRFRWALAWLSPWAAALVLTGCASFVSSTDVPKVPFSADEAPQEPDYASPSSWAAAPGVRSRASSVPRHSGLSDAQATAPADVFFVHPTSYFDDGHWNAPIDGRLTKLITGAMLAGQASAFNGTARIFAPRYRQMTLGGFDAPEGRKGALALAYSDVRRAFAYYLDHWAADRPLILAGHSQGSRMLEWLLDEFFKEAGPLRDRLVAAYLPGARLGSGPDARGEAAVAVCRRPDQIRCLVSWRTFSKDGQPHLDVHPMESTDGETVCVNPLTWHYDDLPASPSLNLGAVGLPMLRGPGEIHPGLTGARCRDGVLWIDDVSGWGFGSSHDDGNWHAYDYALFYMNVRENAAVRVQAWQRSEASAPRDVRAAQGRRSP